MFPIRDNIPSPRFPFVNTALIIISVWVFIHGLFNVASPESFMLQYALVPGRDAGGAQPFGYLPFFSSMFLHGGFFHLILNMWSLWIFGDNVEGRMGPVKYLCFYLLCGLTAAIVHTYFNLGSNLPVVGASGAIAGVMGAYLFLFPHSRLTMLMLFVIFPVRFEIPAVVFLVIWFVGQLLSASNELATSAAGVSEVGGIAFLAHIGGFLAGMCFLPFFKGSKARRR